MHNSAQLRCFVNGNDDFGVEAFWIGDAARVGYFVPLNGPLNGHPPSFTYVGLLSISVIYILYLIIDNYKINVLKKKYITDAGKIGITWLCFEMTC